MRRFMLKSVNFGRFMTSEVIEVYVDVGLHLVNGAICSA